MKDINEMSDHELLMELVVDKRRRDKLRYVKIAFYGIICLFIVYLGFKYVPKIKELVDSYKQIAAKYDALADELQGTSGKINELASQFSDGTIEKMKSLVGTLSDFLARFGF